MPGSGRCLRHIHSIFLFYYFADLQCSSIHGLGEDSIGSSRVRVAAIGATSDLAVRLGGCDGTVLSGCGSVRFRGCVTLPIVDGRGVGSCLGRLNRLTRVGRPMQRACCGKGRHVSRIAPGCTLLDARTKEEAFVYGTLTLKVPTRIIVG